MQRIDLLDDGPIEYGHAESLAFASLLTEGTHIRLTGQDAERGTFSHRHLVLHDEKTGLKYAPIQNLSGALAPFEIHNSPLSEQACLGFEYGYSAASQREPDPLGGAVRRLRQLRPGDHRQLHRLGRVEVGPDDPPDPDAPARLRGLRPRALERPDRALPAARRRGQHAARQPDHGRPSTSTCCAARRGSQSRARWSIFTPKGLLRLGDAASKLEDLTAGAFNFVLDDPKASERSGRRRPASCSAAARSTTTSRTTSAARRRTNVAIARVELIYPFAKAQLRDLIASYPNLSEIVWVQEEPKNMGCWSVMARRLPETRARRRRVPLHRPPRARQPLRGLPGGAPLRAGADRPHRPHGLRRCRSGSSAARRYSDPDRAGMRRHGQGPATERNCRCRQGTDMRNGKAHSRMGRERCGPGAARSRAATRRPRASRTATGPTPRRSSARRMPPASRWRWPTSSAVPSTSPSGSRRPRR